MKNILLYQAYSAKTFHSLTHINALGIKMVDVDVVFIQAEHIACFCLRNS